MTETPQGPLAARLDALVQKMRERQAEHMRHHGVPCQTDERWHAHEVGEWADDLDALARSLGDAVVPAAH